jgi:hypothetical protein
MSKCLNSSTSLIMVRRDTETFQVIFEDNNAPFDLTDYEVWFTIKNKVTDSDDIAVLQVIIDSYMDPTEGIALIDLSSEQTNITPGNYYYDIRLRRIIGNHTANTIIQGSLRIVQDISQGAAEEFN